MRPMIHRLMFVTDACSFGGAERYVLDMAAAARRREIEPAICWLPWSGAPEDLFDAATQNEIPLMCSSPGGPRRRFERSRVLRAVLQSFGPDALIVNASGRPRFWQTCWQARAAGLPAVWVHHMVEQQDPRRARPQWFGGTVEGPQWWRVPQALRHRLAAQAAVAVITSNEADRNCVARWHNVNPANIRVIPPGVDCTRFRFDPAAGESLRQRWAIEAPAGRASCPPSNDRPPHSPFVIGTAARLVVRKGIEPLIEATARLRARGIPAILIIAGQGPQRGDFESLAVCLNIADAVHFLGFTDDMPAFHNAVDVFALCSETESFGLALAEAMSCARPVVATPTVGARQQIRPMENGWLLATFDPSELADALAALYESPLLRERLARQARADVERTFTIDQTLDRTLRALSPTPVHGRKDCSRNVCHFSGVSAQSL